MSEISQQIREKAQGTMDAPFWMTVASIVEDLDAELDHLRGVISDGAKWIPVEERLPPGKEWKAVLATDGKRVFVETTHPTWWNHKASLYENNGPTVTHWMPLPEAPNELRHQSGKKPTC